MIKHLLKTCVAVLAIAAMATGPAKGQSITTWTLTAPEDLVTGDTVVIVDQTNAVAMSNNNGTSSAPAAVSITLSGDQTTLAAAPATTLQWVVTINGSFYQFHVPGTSNYLYCIDNNNGVRVGTNPGNQFTFSSNDGTYNVPFLKSTATSRYIGVYDEQDWRCYTSVNSNIEDTYVGFYKKTTIPLSTQTVALSAGENWFSTNVEITLADLQSALVTATSGTDTITINSQADGSCTYVPGQGIWRGRLTTLDVAQMYMVKVGAACTLSLTGLPIDPSSHPINIKPGYNWIGMPLDASISTSSAFAGFAVSGHQIISSNGTASYTRGRWSGTLSTLEPGKGYIYYSSDLGNMTFVYPASN